MSVKTGCSNGIRKDSTVLAKGMILKLMAVHGELVTQKLKTAGAAIHMSTAS